MSRRNGNVPKLDLKLNLSPPWSNRRVHHESPTPSRSSTASPTSCVSSEDNYFSSSPDATSMMVAGCPRCLMYVMLPEKDPRCPKCQSTVLLAVFHNNGGGHGSSTTTTTKSAKEELKL